MNDIIVQITTAGSRFVTIPTAHGLGISVHIDSEGQLIGISTATQMTSLVPEWETVRFTLSTEEREGR